MKYKLLPRLNRELCRPSRARTSVRTLRPLHTSVDATTQRGTRSKERSFKARTYTTSMINLTSRKQIANQVEFRTLRRPRNTCSPGQLKRCHYSHITGPLTSTRADPLPLNSSRSTSVKSMLLISYRFPPPHSTTHPRYFTIRKAIRSPRAHGYGSVCRDYFVLST
jgi:hypothetical protein